MNLRSLLIAGLALVLTSTVLWAGYNMRQTDRGELKFENSVTGDAPITFSRQGDVDVFNQRTFTFHDFHGDVAADAQLEDYFDLANGSAAQAVDATMTAGINGTITLVSGNAGTGVAADGSAIGQALAWEADNGNLVIEARVHVDDVTDTIINVGFTDVLPGGTLELPFELNTATVTSTATNAVAWMFDTGATNDNWHCIGVKADTDSNLINAGVAPVNSTYDVLRIEVDSSGNAECFLNGVSHGYLGAAVTATTDLTPIIIVSADTTASRTLTVDYLFVAMDRD